MTRNNSYKVIDVEGFEKDLVRVARRYPKVLDNIESLFEGFEQGDLKGDAITRLKLKGDRVYKTRLENPDANKGKSGGFRVLWYLVSANNEIYPLTIYSKSDQEDISTKQIMLLIKKRLDIV